MVDFVDACRTNGIRLDGEQAASHPRIHVMRSWLSEARLETYVNDPVCGIQGHGNAVLVKVHDPLAVGAFARTFPIVDQSTAQHLGSQFRVRYCCSVGEVGRQDARNCRRCHGDEGLGRRQVVRLRYGFTCDTAGAERLVR